ncbi:MAG: phosphate signaling complex protein PhoU [Clostridiales bacterium]|jgi:phosphate transport system protein|nr:phosphate signaling complex protein PhoU [Clostridiales bacterium]
MRNKFDAEMTKLHTMMIEMGALCESGITCAVNALLGPDQANARRAIEIEEEVDRRERDIEQLCYTLLLRQQPVAKDLRMISASVKMITDMERIGDQVADIAEIALLGNIRADGGFDIIKRMSTACIGMVTNSIDAYVNHDTELAYKLIADDDIVDGCFDEMKDALSRVIAQNPDMAAGYIDLIMAAKYLERIADHAVNIAGWVVFIETNERYQKGERREDIPG